MPLVMSASRRFSGVAQTLLLTLEGKITDKVKTQIRNVLLEHLEPCGLGLARVSPVDALTDGRCSEGLLVLCGAEAVRITVQMVRM